MTPTYSNLELMVMAEKAQSRHQARQCLKLIALCQKAQKRPQ